MRKFILMTIRKGKQTDLYRRRVVTKHTLRLEFEEWLKTEGTASFIVHRIELDDSKKGTP